VAILGAGPQELHAEFSVPSLGTIVLDFTNPLRLPEGYLAILELSTIFVLVLVFILSNIF
jgi:hypothetical protein